MSKGTEWVTGMWVVIAGVLMLAIGSATGQTQETPSPAAPSNTLGEGQVEERGVLQRPLPSPQTPKGPIPSSQKDYVFKTMPSTVHNISKGKNVKIQVSPGYEIFFPEVTSPGKLRVEGLTLDQMVTNFNTPKTFFAASPIETQCCKLLRLPVGPSPQASNYFVGIGAPLTIRAEPGSNLKIKRPIFIKVIVDQTAARLVNTPTADVSLLLQRPQLKVPGFFGWSQIPKACTPAFFDWLSGLSSIYDTGTFSRDRVLAALKGLMGLGSGTADVSIGDLRRWCAGEGLLDSIWSFYAFDYLPELGGEYDIGGEYLVPMVLMPGVSSSIAPSPSIAPQLSPPGQLPSGVQRRGIESDPTNPEAAQEGKMPEAEPGKSP